MAFSLIFILSFCSLPFLITANPLPAIYSDTFTLLRPPISQRSESCTFIGNPDVYGPGIRIGIYSQNIAVYLTKYFIPSQAAFLRDTVTVFSIALFSVCIIFALNPETTYAIELFIIIQILSWNCLTGVRTRTNYSTDTYKNSALRIGFTEIFNVGALVLHAWFWFKGVEELKVVGCEGGSRVFFFGNVELDGWFREVMKVMAVLGLVEHIHDFGSRGIQWWGSRTNMDRKEMESAVGDYGKLQRGRILKKEKAGKREKGNDQEGKGSSKRDESVSAASTRDTISTLTDNESVTRHSNGTHIDGTNPSQSELEEGDSNTTSNQHSIPLFEEIYHGEAFLNHCVTSASHSHFRIHHPKMYTFISRLLIVGRPPIASQDSTSSQHPQSLSDVPPAPSYIQCLISLFRALLNLTYPRRCAILHTHLIRSHSLDIISPPHQLWTALTYPHTPPSTTTSATPSDNALVLASAIQISRLPPVSKRVVWTHCWMDGTIHIFVILQTELTLVWNGVTGMGGLGNVGQLVPFIMGVGGLLLVSGRGLREVWEGRKGVGGNVKAGDGEMREKGHGNDFGKFVDAYEEWKGGYEKDPERRIRAEVDGEAA